MEHPLLNKCEIPKKIGFLQSLVSFQKKWRFYYKKIAKPISKPPDENIIRKKRIVCPIILEPNQQFAQPMQSPRIDTPQQKRR